MKRTKIILRVIFIVMLCGEVYAEPTKLSIPAPRSELDTSSSYHIELLQKALHKAANGRSVPRLEVTMAMEQGRAAHELALGRTIDIFWMGADKERNQTLRVIPIPLERGLLGYRQFIVRKASLAEFKQVKSLQDLTRFTACQGAQWPDTNILRDAQLPVVTSTGYERLFRQIAAGRCDYFPRGFHEINIELAQRAKKYPELVIFESVMLHYPFASYFFVKKDNKALADWVEQGLEKMIDDGELIIHMQKHRHTERAFPLVTTPARRVISIPNNDFPGEQDYTNRRYWFQPDDFVLQDHRALPR